MKKQLLRYLMILLASSSFVIVPSGCDDSLDLEPLDRVSDADYWKSATEFKLAANVFYDYLRGFGNIGLNNAANNINNSNSLDNSRLAGDLGADRGAYARGTNTLVSFDNNYTEAYKWIRKINTLLAKAETYEKPEEIKTYVAEAKFFRAYVYFDKLLTSYGGVILVKDVLTPESAELKAARNTRDETIDFIIQDLEEAIADLPLENAILADGKGRISKGAAQAFLGRVCLYEGTWQKFRSGDATRYNTLLDKAISNSDAVITSNLYSLFKPVALGDSALKYLFILENQKSNPAGIPKSANQEYILAVRYESTNLLKTIPNQLSFGALGADMSRKMADMYLCSDGLPVEKTSVPFSRTTLTSEYKNRDNRMRYFMMVPNFRYWQNATNWHINWDWSATDLKNARLPHNPWSNDITGYSNQQWAAERQVPNSQEGYDFPVIRLSEVYLNYVEALYERNGSVSDADLDKSINIVRTRVNAAMPKLTNAFVSSYGLDMREEIRRERAVELQGEGFRMDDLKRWYIAHIELTKPLLGVRWKGTEFETKYTNPPALTADGDVLADPVGERKFSEKNYLIPIPTNQLQLNPNLKQNPGWE